MSTTEEKSITVVIAGRPFPLRIQPKEEAAIRRVVKTINDKVNQYQLTYTTKDKQDCLAMVLLTYAIELDRHQEQQAPVPPSDDALSDRLKRIEQELDRILEL